MPTSSKQVAAKDGFMGLWAPVLRLAEISVDTEALSATMAVVLKGIDPRAKVVIQLREPAKIPYLFFPGLSNFIVFGDLRVLGFYFDGKGGAGVLVETSALLNLSPELYNVTPPLLDVRGIPNTVYFYSHERTGMFSALLPLSFAGVRETMHSEGYEVYKSGAGSGGADKLLRLVEDVAVFLDVSSQATVPALRLVKPSVLKNLVLAVETTSDDGEGRYIVVSVREIGKVRVSIRSGDDPSLAFSVTPPIMRFLAGTAFFRSLTVFLDTTYRWLLEDMNTRLVKILAGVRSAASV